MKLRLKKGDKVRVITGDQKGKEGVITKAMPSKNRVLIEGVNMVTKHVKPSAQNPKGGIEKKEASLHVSNVMLLEGDSTVKVGFREEKNIKIRFSKKSNKAI